MKIESIQSSDHSPSPHNAAHMSCNLSTVASPPCLNNSAGTPSGPAAFPLLSCLIALLISDLKGCGSLSCPPPCSSVSAPLYNSLQYSFHLLAMSSGFVIIQYILSIFRVNTVQFRLELACYGLDCFVDRLSAVSHLILLLCLPAYAFQMFFLVFPQFTFYFSFHLPVFVFVSLFGLPFFVYEV